MNGTAGENNFTMKNENGKECGCFFTALHTKPQIDVTSKRPTDSVQMAKKPGRAVLHFHFRAKITLDLLSAPGHRILPFHF